MRLFAAVRPPATAIEHLVHALRPFKAETERLLRWSDPDQWHVTCSFYGELPDGEVESVEARLADALTSPGADSFTPLALSLRGAGSFADQTLWIGVDGQIHGLRALMAACADDPDHVRNRPHLTVARLGARRQRHSSARGANRRPSELASFVRALSVYSGPSWQVSEVELVQSQLGLGRSGGPLHTVLRTFRLR